MFHLIDRVYLESERHLTSTDLHCHFAYDKGSPHPISEFVNQDLGETNSFFEEIKNNYENNEELFWQDIIKKSQHEKFIIYANPKLFRFIQLQFWKSIYPKATPDKIYWLYNYYRENEKLVRLIRNGYEDKNIPHDKDHYPYISKEKFINELEAIQVSTFFKNCDKAYLSFENLLIQYALNRNSLFSSYLLKRIESLSWNRWFNNVNSLKNHLLSSPSQINHIVEDFKLDDEFSIIEALSSNPKLKWINDTEFIQGNTDYIKNTYSYLLFEELAIKRDSLDQFKFLYNDEWIDKPFRNFNQEVRSKLTFEGKYEELLQFDIHHGHGCYFLKGMSYFQSNHLLISQIYEYIRLDNHAALSGLAFDHGGYIESHP